MQDRASSTGFSVEHHVTDIDPWVNELLPADEAQERSSLFRVQKRHGDKLNDIVHDVLGEQA